MLALRMAADGEEGFSELMRQYANEFEDRFGMRVEYACEGDPSVVAPRTQAEVLRIAQEALTNARHHAAATVIGLRVVIRNGRMTLRVADNGCGFDTRAVRAGSFGLLSMRERAALIGARLDIQSAPGEGTTISVSAPLNGVRRARAPAEVAA